MCKIKRLTYEESRAEYFTKLIEAHKKALEMVEKFCPDEKIKQKRCSEQNEIIQYINDAQQALKKNEELKRLLKLAIEDIDNCSFCSMCANHNDENKCRKCKAITLDMFKWKHGDEAEKLLKSETLAEFQPVIHAKWVLVRKYRDEDGYINEIFRCSNCEIPRDEEFSYCPSCGAKMDGD